MRVFSSLLDIGCVFLSANAFCEPLKIDVPEDFPRLVVPGHEETMEPLRELFYLHYQSARPLATLWDEWISSPSLWPALAAEGRMDSIRTQWAKALSNRHIDPDGYVATHQHASIAHQRGWPFPFWKQGGPGTWGWHFSLHGIPKGWHGTEEMTQDGWQTAGIKDLGIDDRAWNLELTEPGASVTTPPLVIHSDQAPFIQLRWRASGLENAQPYLEWTTESEPTFGQRRRFYFEPVGAEQGIVYTMIPVYRSPYWTGRITGLRLQFDNRKAGASAGIQALFTQYDTRHNINNPNFIRGCCQYFQWTRDLNFLRDNLNRMRLAMAYLMGELGGVKEKCILAYFPGHDGRSGIELTAEGKKIIHSGRGIGNNYWDLLPMGYRDAYATIHYYNTLNYMATLEEDIAAHPEWNLPGSPLKRDAAALRDHAREIKAFAGSLFWNEKTGRFNCGIDVDGKSYDYGFTFINCEAIAYDFATKKQAESIMQWLTGERIVEEDTSQGKDIYHWRFGPRSTTLRNIDYYGWFWNSPESIPWGGQVQDGGAVLGFSYHDLMSRLKVLGPDNAWQRLQGVVSWFTEVQEVGGYREYYKDETRGTLQGGGRAGGLGLDHEFFESVLVPQVVIRGFLGFEPRSDGFDIHPRLPDDWPSLKVTRIYLHRLVLDVLAERNSVTITGTGSTKELLRIGVPSGEWRLTVKGSNGEIRQEKTVTIDGPQQKIPVWFEKETVIQLSRSQ